MRKCLRSPCIFSSSAAVWWGSALDWGILMHVHGRTLLNGDICSMVVPVLFSLLFFFAASVFIWLIGCVKQDGRICTILFVHDKHSRAHWLLYRTQSLWQEASLLLHLENNLMDWKVYYQKKKSKFLIHNCHLWPKKTQKKHANGTT